MSLDIFIKQIYNGYLKILVLGHKRPFLVWSPTCRSQMSWSQKGGYKSPGHKRPGHKRHGHKRPTTLLHISNIIDWMYCRIIYSGIYVNLSHPVVGQ